MKRNEILKELMRQQGISTAEMSRETGIPYTTLKSIFDNGVEKSSYSSICSICFSLSACIWCTLYHFIPNDVAIIDPM